MQLNSEQRNKLGDFVLSPDWPVMFDFIVSHFEHSVSVDEIDVNNAPETIAAEVMSAQKIKKDIERLRQSCNTLKQTQNQNNTSFK